MASVFLYRLIYIASYLRFPPFCFFLILQKFQNARVWDTKPEQRQRFPCKVFPDLFLRGILDLRKHGKHIHNKTGLQSRTALRLAGKKRPELLGFSAFLP